MSGGIEKAANQAEAMHEKEDGGTEDVESKGEDDLDEPHPISMAVRFYLQATRGIGATAQTVLPHTAKWLQSEAERLERKLKKFIPDFPVMAKEGRVEIDSARDFAEFTTALRQHEDVFSNNAPEVLTRALFMQAFSDFDAFTGRLLKAIYLKNDDLLKGISREISLCDLLEFKDLNAAKRALLDKEIDSFRRDSYVEQFATLEKKFSLTLRKFPEWGEFVELSQRRNIFTHNGGVVSDQYLIVCQREGYKFEKQPSIGDRLTVDISYFGRALRLMSKIALMLGYTLWSKVFPKEMEELHGELNVTIYRSLEQKRWKFVSMLNDFVLSESMRRGLSEVSLRIRIVNIAIALKFDERPAEAMKLLNSVDWSASYRDFKLALAVLSDKFEEAAAIMRSIGKSGEIIGQEDYHTWPLFSKFREQPIFFEAYAEIYGESFIEQARREVDSMAERSTVGGRSRVAEDLRSTDVIDVSAVEVANRSRKRKKPVSKTPNKEG